MSDFGKIRAFRISEKNGTLIGLIGRI